jgi:hypothetical protein
MTSLGVEMSYGRTQHLIESFHLSRSKNVLVAMLTIYIDDSGTSPNQSIAVAAGWIAKTPAWTLLERGWAKVQNVGSHGFTCMHMEEFSYGKGEFEGWDLDKKLMVMRKLTPLITKRALKGFALGVVKKDFDEIVPASLRTQGFENHYTYAIRRVLGMIHDWRKAEGLEGLPIEYIFDFMDLHNPRRMEIQRVFTTLGTEDENLRTYGLSKDGFNFKDKKSLPPLQAADMLAWTIYRAMQHEIKEKDASPIARLTFEKFHMAKQRHLLEGGYNKREHLVSWVKAKGLTPSVSA